MNFAERVNLHTHTARCGHASGAVEEYCREAVNQGVAVLGFSDHAPFPDGRYPESRMDYSELPAYLDDIERMRSRFPELVLLAGAEVDYLQSVGRAFYEETYSAAKGFDYRILGPHFIEPQLDAALFPHERLRAYADATIRAMETGLFDYVAHPDMFMSGCPRWTPELRALAAEMAAASKALDIRTAQTVDRYAGGEAPAVSVAPVLGGHGRTRRPGRGRSRRAPSAGCLGQCGRCRRLRSGTRPCSRECRRRCRHPQTHGPVKRCC